MDRLLSDSKAIAAEGESSQDVPRKRETILIVDDAAMNRALLSDIIGSEYNIIEAKNGTEAVQILQEESNNISLMLLDIVMPEMDGFEVLAYMNSRGWIKDIPVIMVSSESASAYVTRAYDLGVTDFVSRPFDAKIVQKRVANTLMLYNKQKTLIGMVADQIYEREKNNNMMVAILSHIVEFRNGESGLHVLHVNTLTEMLLSQLSLKDERYRMTKEEISLIAMASSLHDIGKIAIPGEILNKPGRLTKEEFEQMKTHTTIGAQMLDDLPLHQDEELVKRAYEIARWHHERYDGKGYPDGLSGDDIPISAQVVALADVYDALTSERVYKPAFSHEKAIEMINQGECGAFNPLLLECLNDIESAVEAELSINSFGEHSDTEINRVVKAVGETSKITASGRTVELLEYERMKYRFFASMSNEIQFEYREDPPTISFSDYSSKAIGLPEFIVDPVHNPDYLAIFGEDNMHYIDDHMRGSTPVNPVHSFDTQINVKGKPRWVNIVMRAIWSNDEQPRYEGAIGKIIDIHESHQQMMHLRYDATHDSLTDILNHASARRIIEDLLDHNPRSDYAFIVVDLDYFKTINDTYGHQYGDKVLQELASRLNHSVREHDVVARIGGDEFLVFVRCNPSEVDGLAKRIFRTACGTREDLEKPLQVSMGIATTACVGRDYDTLFKSADSALYVVKRGEKGSYKVSTDQDIDGLASAELTPIESDLKPVPAYPEHAHSADESLAETRTPALATHESC